MTDRFTIADCRAAGFCIQKGVKPKCAKIGLDFRQLVREGIPITPEVRSIEDAHLHRVLEIADARIAAEKAAE